MIPYIKKNINGYYAIFDENGESLLVNRYHAGQIDYCDYEVARRVYTAYTQLKPLTVKCYWDKFSGYWRTG